MRHRNSTDYIVVHNSATSPSMDWGWEDIDRLHRSRGWLMGGYHTVIRRNGMGEPGRPMEVAGAHAGPRFNPISVSICLIGGIAERPATDKDNRAAQARGFVALPNVPENNFTEEQFKTLAVVLLGHRQLYPNAKIVGHGDLDPRKPHCPGFDLAQFLEDHGIPN